MQATHNLFIDRNQKHRSLFVGEGNLSFSLSLAKHSPALASRILASTYENKRHLSQETADNALRLHQLGAKIDHDVDATCLEKYYPCRKFDKIIFQFPHTGTREPKRGRNPNFSLIRQFLRSAYKLLSASGVVLISAVDSPHYQGAFQFEETAKLANFEMADFYSLDPALFSNYNHKNTHNEETGLEGHGNFGTWVFAPKSIMKECDENLAFPGNHGTR